MACSQLCACLLLLLASSAATAAFANDGSDQYVVLPASAGRPNEPEGARCIAKNSCRNKILTCPKECPKRSDSSKLGKPACFIDCSTKCRCTCKHRKANCYGYASASVCYDPRFVGGDGIMFYFHGKAGQDFCLLNDRNLLINAHFIGFRPEGRKRDYTWVQGLGLLYDSHSFGVAAKNAASWDAQVDQLVFFYDGQEFMLPAGAVSTWVSQEEDVRVERLADANSVEVVIDGLVSFTAEVVPISESEYRIHNVDQLPAGDVFAHLNVKFKFYELSAHVDGVLGQTYRPDFTNPFKMGVPLPIMGGEHKFRVSSLYAADCKACTGFSVHRQDDHSRMLGSFNAKCTSTSTAGGIVCRR